MNAPRLTVALWQAGATLSSAEMRDRVRVADGDHVSVSHTAGLTLLAHTSVRVGVDTEVVRERHYLDALARRTMTDDEHNSWLDSADRNRAFLEHWTRVEAYLKAIGVGVRGGYLTRPGDEWTLVDLEIGPLHVGTLAVEDAGQPIDLRWRMLDEPAPPPMSRFRHGSLGITLGAAMTGLGQVLEPRKKEQAPVVVDHDEPDQSHEPIEMHLDRDDPSASVVILRPWLRDDDTDE